MRCGETDFTWFIQSLDTQTLYAETQLRVYPLIIIMNVLWPCECQQAHVVHTGVFLNHWAFVARVANLLVSHNTVIVKETDLAAYYPRSLHRQQTKTQLQYFGEKGLLTCSGASA